MTTAPRLVAFDLDDTLAPSKSPLPEPVVDAFARLLGLAEVCVISGGRFEQFQHQILDRLPALDGATLDRLHLMPTCGTRYLRHDGDAWVERYAHEMTADEKSRALASLERRAREQGAWESDPDGDVLEDRGSQITFSALGQRAAVERKERWDPDGSRKEALRAAVAEDLPDLEVRSGGSTSVDITHRGVDKATGIEELVAATGLAVGDMLFVGDRLEPGGNDYPVIRTGIPTRAVHGWQDTVALLVDEILPTLEAQASESLPPDSTR